MGLLSLALSIAAVFHAKKHRRLTLLSLLVVFIAPLLVDPGVSLNSASGCASLELALAEAQRRKCIDVRGRFIRDSVTPASAFVRCQNSRRRSADLWLPLTKTVCSPQRKVDAFLLAKSEGSSGCENVEPSLNVSSLIRQLREAFADATEGGSGQVLKVEDLSVHSDSAVILQNVSFQLLRDEKLALVGPNGSGKTTLLQTIAAIAQREQSLRSVCSSAVSAIPSTELSQRALTHDVDSFEGGKKRLSRAERRQLKRFGKSGVSEAPALRATHALSLVELSCREGSGGSLCSPQQVLDEQKDSVSKSQLEMLAVGRGAFIRSGRVSISPAFRKVAFLRQEGLEGLKEQDAEASVLEHVKSHLLISQERVQRQLGLLQEDLERLARQRAEATDPEKQKSLEAETHIVAERFSLLQREALNREAEDRWAETVLHYVGIDQKLRDRPVGLLSGGQRMRVLLAKVLSEKPCLLLLDEPTNHCDAFSSEEIARLLSQLPLPLIVASHDRHFLQRVSTCTISLRTGEAAAKHIGSFRSFLQKRQQRQLQWEGDVEEKKRSVSSLQRKMQERGGTLSASDSERLASLTLELDTLRRSPPPLCEAPSKAPAFSLSYYAGFAHSQCAVELRKCTFGFAREKRHRDSSLQFEEESQQGGHGSRSELHCILTDVSLSVGLGEKVALVGPNGSGKSTLLRALAGHFLDASVVGSISEQKEFKVGQTEGSSLIMLEGMREASRAVERSCLLLEQHHSDVLPMEQTAVEALRELAESTFPASFFTSKGIKICLEECHLLEALGKVGLGGPLSRRCVKSMSGGEKARVNIARALLLTACCARGEMSCGLLLLDEPTNHLDSSALRALTASLRNYPGSLVLASHDATFAAAVADSVFLVDPSDKTLKPWRPGSFVRHTEKDQNETATPRLEKQSSLLSGDQGSAGAPAIGEDAKSARWAALFAEAWKFTSRSQGSSGFQQLGKKGASHSSVIDAKRRLRFGGSGISSGRPKGIKNIKRWH